MEIPLRAYLGHVLVMPAIGFYAFIPLLKTQILILLSKQPQWNALDFEASAVTFRHLLKEMKWSMFMLATILAGLIQNPLAIVFNFPWLIPLYLSPITLYLWECPIINHPDRKETSLLALNAGIPHHCEKLTGLLWSDSAPSTWITNSHNKTPSHQSQCTAPATPTAPERLAPANRDPHRTT
jgi:hypothetical protein